jgi:hypothetical protein
MPVWIILGGWLGENKEKEEDLLAEAFDPRPSAWALGAGPSGREERTRCGLVSRPGHGARPKVSGAFGQSQEETCGRSPWHGQETRATTGGRSSA